METLVDPLKSVVTSSVGNQVPRYSGWKPIGHLHPRQGFLALETKYRDIADGNCLHPSYLYPLNKLETKYRDIADGNYLQGNV